MKEIKFTQVGTWTTQSVIFQCLRVPGRGMDLDEMRRRCRVLDKLEAVEKAKAESLLLEDADFDVVKQALTTNQWGVAEPALLTVVDEIFAAKAPEATVHDFPGSKAGA